MSVLVFAESSEGKFKKVAFEATSYGKQVAEKLNTNLVVLTINASDISELQKYGAEKIVKVTDNKLQTFNAKAYASIVKEVALKENANIVIVDSSANGLFLAPIVAVNLDAGLASNTIALPSNLNPFTVKRKAFSNKAFQYTEITSDTKVIGLAKNSFGLIENEVNASEENFTPTLNDNLFGIKSTSVEKASGKITIADADIVVSAGRGLK